MKKVAMITAGVVVGAPLVCFLIRICCWILFDISMPQLLN